MQQIIDFLLATVSEWGYVGIFVMMLIESTVFPLPSEIVMIPAGYLASKGEMELIIVIFTGTIGSLAGALINYYFSLILGRAFLIKYGKYFFVKERTLLDVEKFFLKHGHISTFVGRLLPVIRHLISIPAGIAKMDLMTFCIYTTLGAFIWVTILTFLGYFIGENEALVKDYLHQISIWLFIFLGILIFGYLKFKKSKNS